MIAPIVEQIHGELGEKVKVLKMDTDEIPSTSMSLRIISIPTVIIFKDRKLAERTVGYHLNMRADLKARLEALIQTRLLVRLGQPPVGCCSCSEGAASGAGPPPAYWSLTWTTSSPGAWSLLCGFAVG